MYFYILYDKLQIEIFCFIGGQVMIKITSPEMFADLPDGNRFIGELPQMVGSSVNFAGKNNVFFCEKGVRLVNTVINFNADNSIVYLCENKNSDHGQDQQKKEHIASLIIKQFWIGRAEHGKEGVFRPLHLIAGETAQAGDHQADLGRIRNRGIGNRIRMEIDGGILVQKAEKLVHGKIHTGSQLSVLLKGRNHRAPGAGIHFIFNK